MNMVSSPLNRGTQGREVANLQAALQALLERAAILSGDEGTRRELAIALRREAERQSYGDATARVVGLFQREQRLQTSAM